MMTYLILLMLKKKMMLQPSNPEILEVFLLETEGIRGNKIYIQNMDKDILQGLQVAQVAVTERWP